METVGQFAPDSVESVADINSVARHERTRTLTVTAAYRLSEQGRNASLLAGGDGRAVQEITLPVPTNRIHVVNVDKEGRARLKLRPRYSLNGNQQVICHDGPPIFDVLPTIEDLLKEAARCPRGDSLLRF